MHKLLSRSSHAARSHASLRGGQEFLGKLVWFCYIILLQGRSHKKIVHMNHESERVWLEKCTKNFKDFYYISLTPLFYKYK